MFLKEDGHIFTVVIFIKIVSKDIINQSNYIIEIKLPFNWDYL